MCTISVPGISLSKNLQNPQEVTEKQQITVYYKDTRRVRGVWAAGLHAGTGLVGSLKPTVINSLGSGAVGTGPHGEGLSLPALREELVLG